MNNQLSSLDHQMSLGDIFAILGDEATAVFASKLSPEMKIRRLLQNANRLAEDSRIKTREARMKAVRRKDPTTKAIEPLEALEIKETTYIAAGRNLTIKIKTRLVELGHDPETKDAQLDAVCKTDEDLRKLVQQRSQLSLDLKEFRTGELAMEQENYQIAWEAYQTNLRILAKRQAAVTMLRERGPAMVEAIRAKTELLALTDQARKEEAGLAKEPSPEAIMKGLEEDFRDVSARVRSDAALDEDLDGLKPVSSEDILAAFDRANEDKSVLAEFDVPLK